MRVLDRLVLHSVKFPDQIEAACMCACVRQKHAHKARECSYSYVRVGTKMLPRGPSTSAVRSCSVAECQTDRQTDTDKVEEQNGIGTR